MASTRPWVCSTCLFVRFNSLRAGSQILAVQSNALDKCINSNDGSKSFLSTQSDGRNKPTTKAVTISKSMRAYMEKVKAHDEMMAAEVADFEIGKRHLANIMGVDPDSFTQQDVDRAIEYLLPSGLFDKRARPMLKNPYEIFPKRKAAQFDLEGRPYHWMYFTTIPNYYSVLYDITWKLEDLKVLEDKLRAEGTFADKAKQINLGGSSWISQMNLKDRLVENIQDKEYNHFVVMMERLVNHPLAHTVEPFIMEYRVQISHSSLNVQPPEVEVDSDGRLFVTSQGSRKSSKATVKVLKPGTGQFTINGTDLRYFTNPLYRETLLSPLSLTNLIGEVDVEADVQLGGPTGQAGAMRLALSKCLTAFVNDEVQVQMRLAGLLTKDPRTHERQKVGQQGSRKKFTWKKR